MADFLEELQKKMQPSMDTLGDQPTGIFPGAPTPNMAAPVPQAPVGFGTVMDTPQVPSMQSVGLNPLATEPQFNGGIPASPNVMGVDETRSRLAEINTQISPTPLINQPSSMTLSQFTAGDPASIAAQEASDNFAMESASREARLPEVGEFRERAVPDASNMRGNRQYTDSQIRDLAGGDATVMARLKAMDEQGIDPATGSPRAADVGLTESEKLARERFEYQKQQDSIESPEQPSALDSKINTIMEATGADRAQATGIAAGTVRMTTNPLTGEVAMVDLTTGASTPVSGATQTQEPSFNISKPEEGQSLFEVGSKFTGAVEAGKRAGQKVTGQLGLDVASPESIQAQQSLETAQGDLVRAFKQSGRFSATEDKRLREELDIGLGALKDPATFENKMRSLDKSLATRMENEKAVYADTTFPPEDRKAALIKMRAIAEFRAQMGVPEEKADAEAGDVPEAVDPEDWKYMTDEQRKLFQ